ncbi:MAG TPA: prepilin-type N-terminal cleavage/methylation domain-containing protein [Gemmatimonadales bacterium]|nr:prepilin-type N-terminal cleavage/methylation domain-containing protein [Gemmatimonadales bacterium]
MINPSLARRGFTLAELLVSLVVTAIIGGALVRMVLSQARFMDQQEAWRGARSVARGGINRLVSDLRLVEATGGVEAASPGGQDFTIRVPYAFGIMCRTAATVTTVSLLPVDSAMFAAPGYSGFAWRDTAGVYTYIPSAVLPVIPGTEADCTGALPTGFGITTLGSINGSPAGQVVNLTTGAALSPVPPVGSIVFLYRRVRYEFKNSVVLPGRTGLWRTTLDAGGTTEELAAPFATTARINFYRLNSAISEMAVPAQLSEVRGLELVLDGMSEGTPRGSATPKTANVVTSVFFENRPD